MLLSVYPGYNSTGCSCRVTSRPAGQPARLPDMIVSCGQSRFPRIFYDRLWPRPSETLEDAGPVLHASDGSGNTHTHQKQLRKTSKRNREVNESLGFCGWFNTATNAKTFPMVLYLGFCLRL